MSVLLASVLSSVPWSPAAEIPRGAVLAVMGMAAVFGGLLLLMVLLPVIRRAVEAGEQRKSRAETPPDAPPNLTPEEVAAVSAAIHLHLRRMDQAQETGLTWRDHEKPYSPWRLAGRAKLLLARTGLRLRDRRV